MAEDPTHSDDRRDHREVRRARLGAALRENLKRRKAQARGRDGKSPLAAPAMASSGEPSDSADELRGGGQKETQE